MTRQQWVRVNHTPTATTVTCTVVEGTNVVRWTEPAYTDASTIRAARAAAISKANLAMLEIQAAERKDRAA